MPNNIYVIEIPKELDKTFYRHIKNIARHLRKADRDEVSAISADIVEDVILRSYGRSSKKWVVMKEERIILNDEGAFRSLFIPIVIFGVMDHPENKKVGVPWMVATDNIKSIGSFIRKNSRYYIGVMMKTYEYLFNFVDSRNKDYMKWLEWCGFKLDKAAPIGDKQILFHKFYMGAI